MSPRPKAYLFDFDLTLADSSAGIISSAQAALDQMDFPVPDADAVRRSIGLPLEASFTFLTANHDAALAKTYSRYFVAHADKVMVAMTHFYPSVPPLLGHLRKQGIRVGIVSTKFRYRIDAILRHAGLEPYVDIVVGGEDVARHKPHPEGIRKALGAIAVAPADAVYVGDHIMDAQAARAAGTRFIGAVTGSIGYADWQAEGESAVRKDLSELLDIA
ncbi:MAG TPA: HAD-IA family hydrolase [Bordetella sp.]